MNQGVYPDHGSDLAAWAWEYLRRNPEYQADFAQWNELPDSDGNGNWSCKHESTIGDWVDMKFCAPLPSLPAFPGETVGEYERRTGHVVETLYQAFRSKWELFPAAPSSTNCIEWEVFPPPYSLWRLDKSFVRNDPMLSDRLLYSADWGEEDDPFIESVGFDLRFKIDDQWAAIRPDLLEYQSRKKAKESARELKNSFGVDDFTPEPIKVANRNVVSKLGDHETKLRYLDAVAAAASDEEIINKLYPGESAKDAGNDEEGTLRKNGAKWLADIKKTANELMTRKYRTLVLFDLIPKAEK